MKRQEWNSMTPLARLAFSIWHLITISLAFCLRLVITLLWRLLGRSPGSKNTHGWHLVSGQPSLEEASAYHAAYDRPYDEPEPEPDLVDHSPSRRRSLHVALL